jgi:flagellar P-ring protein precursor FlgI
MLLVTAALVALVPGAVDGQQSRIRDLTVAEQDIPVRLMGYGLVTGLDGTGDRVIGGFSSGHTVRSIANVLRRFGVEVPENILRTRNVAAVLVTAEVSPYLRPGGRMPIHVSSVGDAVSLRGGVLWLTPLVADPGGEPVGSAQGALLVSEATEFASSGYQVETTARIPEGGLLEQALGSPDFASTSVLYLRRPDLGTAARIAQAINGALGAGSAAVEDPGAVTLALQGDAGGGIQVGEAVVSHGSMTLAIGGAPGAPGAVGDLRVPEGTSVQEVAAALHAVAAPPRAIAAVFESLKEVGAISAEVTIR